MSKEHEHNFVAEKIKVQEEIPHYLGSSGGYKVTVLEHERVVLFCTTCGVKVEDKEKKDD